MQITAAVVAIDGTALIDEPIVSVKEYKTSKFFRAQGWGPIVIVEFNDGSELLVWANEIFISVTEG